MFLYVERLQNAELYKTTISCRTEHATAFNDIPQNPRCNFWLAKIDWLVFNGKSSTHVDYNKKEATGTVFLYVHNNNNQRICTKSWNVTKGQQNFLTYEYTSKDRIKSHTKEKCAHANSYRWIIGTRRSRWIERLHCSALTFGELLGQPV